MQGRKPKKAPAKRVAPKAAEAVSRPFAVLAKRAPAEAKKKPAATTAKRPTSTDDLAFSIHMQGVTPLAGKKQRIPATASALEPSSRSGAKRGKPSDPDPDLDDDARDDLVMLVSAAHRFELVDDGTLLEGRRLDVDPRELRRLRKQRYAVDGKLDLHGQNSAGAKEAVERFVERRRMQGDRAVLIVHGKGIHSPRQTSVLRGEIGAWLSQGRAAKDILAFASLEDEDGSSGALMVLLAKR